MTFFTRKNWYLDIPTVENALMKYVLNINIILSLSNQVRAACVPYLDLMSYKP